MKSDQVVGNTKTVSIAIYWFRNGLKLVSGKKRCIFHEGPKRLSLKAQTAIMFGPIGQFLKIAGPNGRLLTVGPNVRHPVPPITITERIIALHSQRKMKFRRLKEEQTNKSKPQMSANERGTRLRANGMDGWNHHLSQNGSELTMEHHPNSMNHHHPISSAALHLMTTTLRWTMMSRRKKLR